MKSIGIRLARPLKTSKRLEMGTKVCKKVHFAPFLQPLVCLLCCWNLACRLQDLGTCGKFRLLERQDNRLKVLQKQA